MYKKLFLSKSAGCCALLIAYCLFASAQSYKKLHFNSIVVDTHNDILMMAADKGVVLDQDLTGKNA